MAAAVIVGAGVPGRRRSTDIGLLITAEFAAGVAGTAVLAGIGEAHRRDEERYEEFDNVEEEEPDVELEEEVDKYRELTSRDFGRR